MTQYYRAGGTASNPRLVGSGGSQEPPLRECQDREQFVLVARALHELVDVVVQRGVEGQVKDPRQSCNTSAFYQ